MNPMNPILEPVVNYVHEERLAQAERNRLLKDVRAEDNGVRGARQRLGIALVRAGARLLPEDQRMLEANRLEHRAA